MASMNKVFLIGNLTRDPEVRYLPSGAAVGDLRLAVNRKYKTQQGEEREETCFVNVSVWGRQAETCGQYLGKGSAVLVEGRLRFEEWEKDGQKNSRISVTAERVQFMSAPRSGADYGDSPASSGASTRPSPAAMPDRGGPPPAEDRVDDEDLPF